MSHRRPAARLEGDACRARHGHVGRANLGETRPALRRVADDLRCDRRRGAGVRRGSSVARRWPSTDAARVTDVKPVQHLLVLLGSNHLLGGDIHTATDRHQQEGMQSVGAEAPRELKHSG